MPDARFFQSRGPLSLGELARAGGVRLREDDDGDRLIQEVASPADAGPDSIAYCAGPREIEHLATDAGACITTAALAPNVPTGTACLVADDPRLAYARIASVLYPDIQPPPGVSDRAVVAPDAVLGHECRIDAGAVIESGAEIGARAWIGCNTIIGPGVVIGARTRIGPNATILCAVVGADVRVDAGVRIGQPGFGFVMTDTDEGHQRVPQLGRVRIGDRADIGANVCIDRGALGDTVIGAGAFLDNLVHIAHNVEVGAHVVLAGQVGIAGSSTVGAHTAVGGQAGISDNISVGAACKIGAQAGVLRNLDGGASVSGTPAVPVMRYLRQVVALARLTSDPHLRS